jgi:PAS domain S-box-containing protein
MLDAGSGNFIPKILIAEDDRLTRKMLAKMLEGLGLSADFAEDGAQGLELFSQNRYDLVISDYNMPEMNGIDMLREIREIRPSIKIVLMTIYTESDVLIKAINLGVNRFLEKPVTKDNLQKVLAILLEEITLSRELTRHQNLLKSYRAGVDSSTIFSLLDTEGNFTYVNKNLCFISEYSESELLGHHFSMVRRDDTQYDLLKSDSLWQGCIINVAKSGHEYVTEASLLPIIDNDVITGYISIEKDMTLMVAEHQQKLKDFFDADSSIIIAFDKQMNMKTCNDACLDFFGMESMPSEFCLQDYMEEAPGDFSGSTEYKSCDSLREMLRSYDKLDISKIAVRGKDGGVSYFMLNMFVLNQSYIGLDDLIVVRLNDITELENLKKDEMNSVMLASIGKLAAGITHEINTPLTYIKGNIELLKWDFDDLQDKGAVSGTEEYFNSISDGIDRISLIIESMREVTGEAKFEMKSSNLYATFVVACRMVYNRSKHISNIYLNGRKVSLESKLDEEELMADISPKMLEQVWIILLNNSLDQLSQSDLTFEEKYIKIDIEKNASRYMIHIRDNGGGIPDHVLGRIFDLFASTKKHKGMGIGLNIAKTIIEKHEGTIKPFNDDFGAVFEISL